MSKDIQDCGDSFTLLTVSDPLHTKAGPFCYNPNYPCHEDPEGIAQVAEFVKNGLMSEQEASDFVKGKHL